MQFNEGPPSVPQQTLFGDLLAIDTTNGCLLAVVSRTSHGRMGPLLRRAGVFDQVDEAEAPVFDSRWSECEITSAPPARTDQVRAMPSSSASTARSAAPRPMPRRDASAAKACAARLRSSLCSFLVGAPEGPRTIVPLRPLPRTSP